MAEPAAGAVSGTNRVQDSDEPAAVAVVILPDGGDAARRAAEPLVESFRRKRVDVRTVSDPYRALLAAANSSRVGAATARLAVFVGQDPAGDVLAALARYAPGVSCWRYGDGALAPALLRADAQPAPVPSIVPAEPARLPAPGGPPRLRLAGDGPEPARTPHLIEPRPVRPLRDAIFGEPIEPAEPIAPPMRLAGVGDLPQPAPADSAAGADAANAAALTSEELAMLLGDGPLPETGGAFDRRA